MKGFKGFNKDLTCRDFQYEVGETYSIDKYPVCCETGFHMCPRPLDMFKYYAPSDSRYCVVEGGTDMDRSYDKVACSKMTIRREMTPGDLYLEALANVNTDRTTRECAISIAASEDTSSLCATKNFRSIAAHTGGYGMSVTIGDASVAVSGGHRSMAYSAGKGSMAIVTGNRSKATGEMAIAAGYDSLACSSSIAIATKGNRAAVEWPGSTAISLHGGEVKGVIGSTLIFVTENGTTVNKVDGRMVLPDTWYSKGVEEKES